MTKTKINEVISKLEETKKIILSANEEDFIELGRLKKAQIYDLFNTCYTGESDGDSDDCSMIFYFDGFEVVFYSQCEYTSDIKSFLANMYFNYQEGQFKASIQNIDNFITYLMSIIPKVVGVFNASIMTAPGDYSLKLITLEQAQDIAQNSILDSAIGHKSTAQIMTSLLGVEINENRQQFIQEVGQQCLVFKLRDRAPEGVILTAAEIKRIGYDFQLLTRKS